MASLEIVVPQDSLEELEDLVHKDPRDSEGLL